MNVILVNDLSNNILFVIAIYELLDQVYENVWANAIAQLTALGLWNEPTTLARYLSPDDLSMAPSLFTTVGKLQTPANGTEMESITSKNTVIIWERKVKTDDD